MMDFQPDCTVKNERTRGECVALFSVDTIVVPDILLNLDVTCLFKAQYKPKGPGMQPGPEAITGTVGR